MIHAVDELSFELAQEIEWSSVTDHEQASFTVAMTARQQSTIKRGMAQRLFLSRLTVTLCTVSCAIAVMFGVSAEAMLLVLSAAFAVTTVYKGLVWWTMSRVAKTYQENALSELQELHERHPTEFDDSDAEMIVDRLTEVAAEATESHGMDT